MTFAEFQKRGHPRVKLPKKVELFVYALGLNEEAGEVAGKIKKVWRDKKGKFDNKIKKAIKLELADVLFYVRATAEHFGWTLEDIAKECVQKLDDREKRGVLHGEGDYR